MRGIFFWDVLVICYMCSAISHGNFILHSYPFMPQYIIWIKFYSVFRKFIRGSIYTFNSGKLRFTHQVGQQSATVALRLGLQLAWFPIWSYDVMLCVSAAYWCSVPTSGWADIPPCMLSMLKSLRLVVFTVVAPAVISQWKVFHKQLYQRTWKFSGTIV